MSAAADPDWHPEVTLPPAETEAVIAAYAGARVILEYGAGGSTVLAGQVPGARVFAVESDGDWLRAMRDWFAANPPEAEVVLHHAEIGPTRRWGFPIGEGAMRRWPGYALSVWDRPDFVAPDVVLIDGRFRLAAFLTVLIRATGPVTVLWDDYAGRPVYHAAERFVAPVARIGRMARFEVEPGAFRPEGLALLAESFFSPH